MKNTKAKVWDRLKHGLRETEAEKAHRFSNEYFESEHWQKVKAELLKDITEAIEKDV